MYNVAIDGPAGAGKSTIAKKIAKKLGFIYVDTGAMYRAMALACIRNGVNKEDEQAVIKVCSGISVTIAYEGQTQIVMLNGENVNDFIRTEEVGNTASAISVYKEVRLKLLELQRNLAKENDVIMDGRDIGTCVLPDAFVKIYLTASSKTRAERRCLELKERGVDVNIDEVEKDIIDRDYRDMHREIAPLSQAKDAVLVDSSDMGIDEVVEHIIKIIEDRK